MAFDFACPDWVERLEQGLPPFPDLPLDEAAADQAVAIFDNLRLPDVIGQPLIRDTGGDWFRALIRAAFGSADADGENQVKEIFCLVPKKMGKTTYSAAAGITALMLNEIPNVEMLIVGPTKDIADTCFSQIKGMIEADPEDPKTGRHYLQDRFQIKESEQVIVDRHTGARLSVKAFSAKVITGEIPVFVIVDELHELGKMAAASRILTEIRGGMSSRPNTLLLFITTQPDDPPAGVMKAELDMARKVRDGLYKGGWMLACLYEFPEKVQSSEGKAWRDPKLWPMVLPNLGQAVTLERLVQLHRAAAEKGVDEEAHWAAKHLNVQVGMALFSDRWVGVDYWPAASLPSDLEAFLDRCEVVTAGVDGGGLDDLMGAALVGRHRETRALQGWGRAWAKPVVLKKRKDIAPRLMDFAEAGELVICEDATQDLREIAELFHAVQERGLFPEKFGIGLDPYGITALLDELTLAGLAGEGLELVASVGQGTRLSPAIWGLERDLEGGRFFHSGQALMDWCVSNARAEQRGSAVMITKQMAGKAKIDPLVALFNAYSLMSRNPEAAGGRLGDFLANPVMVI